MKNKRGPKSEPVDKLRTLATLAALDILCPDVLKLEERNKVWRWRKMEVAMSPGSLRLLCGRITRAAAMGGKDVAQVIERTYKIGPDCLPVWDAFHPAEGQDVAWYFAFEIGADTQTMRPDKAAAAVVEAHVPPMWKLAAATSAALHFYFPKVGVDSTEADIGVHTMLVDALRQAEADLAKHGLDPLTWGRAMLDQIEYFPFQTSVPRLVFEKVIFPAL